jgi:hypothetical protein
MDFSFRFFSFCDFTFLYSIASRLECLFFFLLILLSNLPCFLSFFYFSIFYSSFLPSFIQPSSLPLSKFPISLSATISYSTFPCAAGTYSEQQGLYTASQCTICSAGSYCVSTALNCTVLYCTGRALRTYAFFNMLLLVVIGNLWFFLL